MNKYKIQLPDHCWYCSEVLKAIENEMNSINKDEMFNVSYGFGINEITRLVKHKMSTKTAIKHIHELINIKYLVDERQDFTDMLRTFIKMTLDGKIPISKDGFSEDTFYTVSIEGFRELITEIFNIALFESPRKEKRKILLNTDKLKTATS